MPWKCEQLMTKIHKNIIQIKLNNIYVTFLMFSLGKLSAWDALAAVSWNNKPSKVGLNDKLIEISLEEALKVFRDSNS